MSGAVSPTLSDQGQSFREHHTIGIWRDGIGSGNGYSALGCNPVNNTDVYGLDVVPDSTMGPLALGDIRESDLANESEHLKFLFDGEKVYLWHDTMGEIESWLAYSGKSGSNLSIKDQTKKEYGPIPEGTYTVNPSDTLVFAKIDPERKDYPYASWGTYATPIRPAQGTETYGRGGFYLHGGVTPGSAGCVDLVEFDVAVHNVIKKIGKRVKFLVDYPGGKVNPSIQETEKVKK